ncbi:hypothetical protein [Variovorax sp. WS11]|uniref:hypothetical protein n=1 Tax=Variovorax sp. WS11 TaxID=1105204 RepID=UPI0013DB6A22|nr:hypothetical protein [Variovorax sp. WS11]NDZ15832.1 hypothetical protein [Variovorax sp. WS11]
MAVSTARPAAGALASWPAPSSAAGSASAAPAEPVPEAAAAVAASDASFSTAASVAGSAVAPVALPPAAGVAAAAGAVTKVCGANSAMVSSSEPGSSFLPRWRPGFCGVAEASSALAASALSCAWRAPARERSSTAPKLRAASSPPRRPRAPEEAAGCAGLVVRAAEGMKVGMAVPGGRIRNSVGPRGR